MWLWLHARCISILVCTFPAVDQDRISVYGPNEINHSPESPGMLTLEDRLIAAKHRPSGFDYLRLGLSISVVLSHTINITYGGPVEGAIQESPLRPIIGLLLPMFFALSGFLVAGSLERCRTLFSFLGLRGIRLIPALMVDTVLSALIIGTIFTTLPLSQYFSDPLFRLYFLNIIGVVHFSLPGVFDSNPVPSIINSQLWTLPYEMFCYLSLSSLAFLRIVRRSRAFIPVLLGLNAALLMYELYLRPRYAFPFITGLALVQGFLYGIAFYLYRAKVIWNSWLAIFSLIATAVLMQPRFQLWGDYIQPIFSTYLTVYIGLFQPRRLRFMEKGDYSYGIYLYGFPLQEVVVYLTGEAGHHWYINAVLALPLIFLVAMFSWWCVEKPALKLRPMLIRFEDRFVALRAKFPGLGALLPEPLPHRGRPSIDPAVQKAA